MLKPVWFKGLSGAAPFILVGRLQKIFGPAGLISIREEALFINSAAVTDSADELHARIVDFADYAEQLNIGIPVPYSCYHIYVIFESL